MKNLKIKLRMSVARLRRIAMRMLTDHLREQLGGLSRGGVVQASRVVLIWL